MRTSPSEGHEQHPKGAESNESPPVMDQGGGNSASRCAVISRGGQGYCSAIPQTNDPARGEDNSTELWHQGCHCCAQEALTTPQFTQRWRKLWLLLLNPWQLHWRAQPACFACQIEVSFTCCCWNSPSNHNPRTVCFLLFPCDRFMELIYEPCSLDHTFPNCNRLACSSSSHSCFTVLMEQPQKQSLRGGKEQCLRTESVLGKVGP